MTNAEYYETRFEQIEAFNAWCMEKQCGKSLQEKDECDKCFNEWKEMEYAESTTHP